MDNEAVGVTDLERQHPVEQTTKVRRSKEQRQRSLLRSRRMLPAATTASVLILSIGGWQILSAYVIRSILLPTPSVTAAALWNLLGETSSRSDITTTLWRIAKGFVAGSGVGIILGVLMGLSNVGQFLVEPHVNFFRFITPIALITPASVWFGVNEFATFVLVIYATTWPVAISTCAGMRSIVPNRVRMARSFSSDDLWPVTRHVILPSLIPQVVVGMRLGLSYSIMTVVGLEMLAGSDGLGNLIYTSRVLYQSDVMFAGIILLGAIGFLGDRIFVLIMDRSLGRYSYGSSHR